MAASALFTWTVNTEADLAGYRIYHGLYPGLYLGYYDFPFPTLNSTQMVADNPQPNASYPNFKYDGLWYFSIAAYDTSGNEGALSTPQTKRIVMTVNKAIHRR